MISTGKQHYVKEFANLAFSRLGMDYRKYLKIDKSLNRPSEVNSLLGDCKKANRKLNWKPKINFKELVYDMVDSDFKNLKKNKGY